MSTHSPKLPIASHLPTGPIDSESSRSRCGRPDLKKEAKNIVVASEIPASNKAAPAYVKSDVVPRSNSLQTNKQHHGAS
jgi:hypothetical protein